MESTAKMTIRQSSKKVRFVLDEIRNSNVNDALAKLSFMNKKTAKSIHQTIVIHPMVQKAAPILRSIVPWMMQNLAIESL